MNSFISDTMRAWRLIVGWWTCDYCDYASKDGEDQEGNWVLDTASLVQGQYALGAQNDEFDIRVIDWYAASFIGEEMEDSIWREMSTE